MVVYSNPNELSKDDETSTEDVPVRREDQEKINRFSRLHNRESALEQDLKQKQVRVTPSRFHPRLF
jgi:prefoldin subunit 4